MAIIENQIKFSKNGKKIICRNALPEDAPLVLEFARQVLSDTPFMLLSIDEFLMTEEKEKKWLEGIMNSQDELALILLHDQKVVGFLDFHMTSNRRKIAHCGSFGMSVEKEYQNVGLGKILLQKLFEWGKVHPTLEKISLEVHAKNHGAIALYKKLGFIEEGRKIKALKFSENNYDDIVLMYQWVK